MKLVYVGLVCLCLYVVSAEDFQAKNEIDSDVAGPPVSFGYNVNPIEKESLKSDEQIEGQQEKDILSQEDLLNELSNDIVENEDATNKQLVEGYVLKVCS